LQHLSTICDKNDLELQQSKNFGKYLIEHLKITTKTERKAEMVYLEKDRGDDPAREREETDTDRERRECFALGDLLQNNTMFSQLSLWFKHTHSKSIMAMRTSSSCHYSLHCDFYSGFLTHMN
jgi:hypothetical protein